MKSAQGQRRDPLLAFREEFPILEKTTYLASNSLGPMPRTVPEKLAEYARDWGDLGVRRGTAAGGSSPSKSATRSRPSLTPVTARS